MTKQNNHYLTSFIILLSLLAGLFSLHVTSDITTGIGFGKDAKIIVYSENENRLDDFLVSETKKLKEVRKTLISENTYLLTMSGVEQIDEYKEKLESTDYGLEAMVLGSFGTLTRLKNNEGFIAIYFLVFFMLMSAYFAYRFKMVGYVLSLELILLIMGSLFITQYLGYPYTKTLWYALLLSIVILFYFQQRMLRYANNESLNSLTNNKELDKRKHFFYEMTLAFFFYVIGFITLRTTVFTFNSVGIYMMTLSGLILVKHLIERIVIFPMFIFCAEKDNREDALLIQDESLTYWRRNESKTYALFNSVLLLFLLISIVIGIGNGFSLKESEDYTNQNVMVINQGDANAYLEIQAILHKEDMETLQKSYEVSEQEHLWIKFHDDVEFSELENVGKIISKEMNASVTYYNTSSALNPLESQFFYTNLGCFIMASWLMVYVLLTFKKSLIFLLMTTSSLALFVFLVVSLQFEWTREIVFVAWSLPFLIAAIMMNDPILFLRDKFKHNYLKLSETSVAILFIMAIPVFIIVPTTIAVEMVGIVALMILSVHLNLMLLYLLIKYKDGKYERIINK